MSVLQPIDPFNLFSPPPLYCDSLSTYSRRQTCTVRIGDLPLGSAYPIRVQSMTTADTMDTAATLAECIRMAEAGCEYIRITATSVKEAENLRVIRSGLHAAGFRTPLIADIHFTPNAAELAARIVEKVRINPGNYADKKKFEILDYNDSGYQAELERIRLRFEPLVRICKEYGTAMRIGTNHGSLSDRILSRYGDTPLGMVESALEFLRICQDMAYHNVVLSMKASNTQVMVQAYRLLVSKLKEENMLAYPLHLGVTEAGDGEDGRVKSAVGIGTLLEDGLGDTIRVSLTEAPEFEIPVAQRLANRYTNRANHAPIAIMQANYLINPYHYSRRGSVAVGNIGGGQVPCVVADFSQKMSIEPANLFGIGYKYSVPLDKWNIDFQACDYIFLGNNTINFPIPGTLSLISNYTHWLNTSNQPRHYPLFDYNQYLACLSEGKAHAQLNFLSVSASELLSEQLIEILKSDKTLVLVLHTDNTHALAAMRRFFVELINNHITVPVVIRGCYPTTDTDTLMIEAATDVGGLLVDGLGDGIFLQAHAPLATLNRLGFGILQAARTRMSKTEYISCPSCGRTLFDLQETTNMIRSRTDHLKGLKIGIMGCIVNGPGEMADADYGYVGVGKDKIALYRGQNIVKKAVPASNAVDELIMIIQEDGRWTAPEID